MKGFEGSIDTCNSNSFMDDFEGLKYYRRVVFLAPSSSSYQWWFAIKFRCEIKRKL